MTDKQNELVQFIEEARNIKYEAYDGLSYKQSAIGSMDFYMAMFKSNKFFVNALQSIKRLNQIPLNDPQLYLRERDLLLTILPQLLDYTEKQKQKRDELHKQIAARIEELEDAAGKDIKEENHSMAEKLELISDVAEVTEGFVYEIARPIVENASEYADPEYIPCATHYPAYCDVSKTHAGEAVYLAVANAARLYGSLIYNNFFYADKAKETVRMWKKDGDKYTPLNVLVDKKEILENELASNSNLAIWPMMYAHALENSGLEIDRNSVGQITEAFFGETLAYMDYSQLLHDAYDDEETKGFLFASLEKWIQNGFPISLKLSFTDEYPQGWYNLLGVYENRESGTRYLRITNLSQTFDIDYYGMLKDIVALDVNMSDEIAGVLQAQRIGFDIITESDQSVFLWHMVNKKTRQSYLDVTLGLYSALLVTLKVLGQESPEILAYYNLLGDFIGILSCSMGCNDSIIHNYLKPLAKASDMLEEILAENKDGVSRIRVYVCRAVKYLNEIFEYNDNRRFDPQKEFMFCFAQKLSRAWFKHYRLKLEDDVIEFKAKELMENPLFVAFTKSITGVTLLFPTDKQLDTAMVKCRMI